MKRRIQRAGMFNRLSGVYFAGLLLPLLSGLVLSGLLLPGLAQAQQFEQIGNYKIHYNAVNTSFLSPEVATANKIQRSKALALLNISVREELDSGKDRAVNATVKGEVSNQAGQVQSLTFRRVQDGEAIYYLSTFRIQQDEPMKFALDVIVDANQPPAEVNFIQRFYIDP